MAFQIIFFGICLLFFVTLFALFFADESELM